MTRAHSPSVLETWESMDDSMIGEVPIQDTESVSETLDPSLPTRTTSAPVKEITMSEVQAPGPANREDTS